MSPPMPLLKIATTRFDTNSVLDISSVTGEYKETENIIFFYQLQYHMMVKVDEPQVGRPAEEE